MAGRFDGVRGYNCANSKVVLSHGLQFQQLLNPCLLPQGEIKEAELEEENGKLVWSFDIAMPHPKDITEVQVNAVTGEIVSVEKETPADQKKEKKKEAK